MQQEGGGRRPVGEMTGLQQQQQRQGRRVKPPAAENQQRQQPQICPRCESLNTKFCYYNNYSLSQPRYFCKRCRRYWTQGGTLRNVPVGGGCRKGKRSKRPPTAKNPPPRSATQLQDQQQQLISASATASKASVTSTAAGPTSLSKSETDIILDSSSVYYPGRGFLSSLATLQPFNQPMNARPEFGGSNLALLQGCPSLPSFMNPLQVFPQVEDAIQATCTRPTSHQDWQQSFINATNPNKSESVYWASSGPNSNRNINTGGSSSIPSQWMSDPPGYDPSSQPFL